MLNWLRYPHDEGLHSARFWLLALGHLALFSLTYWLAYLLRFGFDVPAGPRAMFWISLPWVLALKFAIFYASGHYHGWWRYVTFSDLAALLRAAVVSFLVLGAVDYFVRSHHIPSIFGK